MNRRWGSLSSAALVGFLAAGMTAAYAADCPQLTMVASVPMTYDGDGRPIVPVTIGTAQKYMLVDTGGAFSEIGQPIVDQLGLSHEKAPVEQIGVSGETSDQQADVAPFIIGNLVAKHVEFMIDPDKSKYAGGMAGIVGPTILRFYDADFDFGANKFNLLSQDHCPGKVIYWPAAAVAVVPIRVAKAVGHIVVPVTLDGIKFNAAIDTGASYTFMTTGVAEGSFGLKLDSADTPTVGALAGPGATRVYRHKFHSLELEGIAISNPTIDIIPDLNRSKLSSAPALGSRLATHDEAQGLEDITIGDDVLRHLHVYVAYKEQMLYLTPAGAPAVQPATGAPSTAPATPAPTH
jgi:predicted aspartyl protease